MSGNVHVSILSVSTFCSMSVMIRLYLWAASVSHERMPLCHVLVCPQTSTSALSVSGCVHGLYVRVCVSGLGGCVCVPRVCVNVSASSQHVMSMHEEHVHLEGTRPCCPAASPGGGAFLWLLFHLSCSVFEEKGEPSLHGDFWAAHGTETGHAQ